MSKLKNLSDLQNQMQEAVQQKAAPAELINVILEKPPISVNQRLKIYQDAYQIRLLESLRDDFSRFETAIGTKQFDVIALDYIRCNPSRFQNLAEYSEGFPLFVQEKHAELSKAAITDWLEVLSHHAREPQDQISPEEIQAGKAFKIKLHPSTYFREVRDVLIVVYRDHDEAQSLDLDVSSFRLLQFFQTAKSLEEVTAFAKTNSLQDEVVASTLHEWIKNKIIYTQSLSEEDL